VSPNEHGKNHYIIHNGENNDDVAHKSSEQIGVEAGVAVQFTAKICV
jgi:hypothetical protein